MSFGGSVISSFRTGTYTVTRRAGNGVTSGGHYTPPSPATFTIQASIQPASGRELRDLKEGQSAGDLRTIFTLTELRTVRADNDQPDVISIDGENYRITKVEYFGVISNHYRCVCEKTSVP